MADDRRIAAGHLNQGFLSCATHSHAQAHGAVGV
jgi:hypothetical protein